MADCINEREIVFDMLMAIEKEQTPSHLLLAQTLIKYQYLEKKQRALISRLFRGVLEYQIYLDWVIGKFSTIKINKIKPPVRCMLRIGAYQILKMENIPDSAACNEMVKLAKKRGLKNLSGFVNGVLRNISRQKETISYPDAKKQPEIYLSKRYALPEWLVRLWLHDYDYETVVQMAEAMLAEQPTCVRVRDMKQYDAIVDEMKNQGVNVEPGKIVKDALRISDYDYLNQITAFCDGKLTVQDESTMLAAAVSGVKKNDQVIDVCAAPGGKSIHLADLMMGTGCVEARDLTEYKIMKIRENLDRLKVTNVSAHVQDALVLDATAIGTADVVMADLPCSGLGVIGRKPDIKLHMSLEQIKELAELQRRILAVVYQYVKPGGVLIYSTCTVSRAENEENAAWFAENFPFKRECIDVYLPKAMRDARTAQGQIQILPGQYASDGFFITKFRRCDDGGCHE